MTNYLPSRPTYDGKAHLKQVQEQYAKYPLKDGAAIAAHAVTLLKRSTTKKPHAIIDAIADFIASVYYDDSIYNEFEPTREDQVYLSRMQAQLTEERIKDADALIIKFLKAFFERCPPLIFERATSTMHVPLHTLVSEYPALVHDTLYYFERTTSANYPTFPVLRMHLQNNIRAISGKKTIEPADYKGDLLDYLRNTPFEDLFNVSVPFSIPRETYASHGIILAPPRFGKTQLAQTILVDLIRDTQDPVACFVLDPHGRLFSNLRERVDPSRLVVIDPDDPRHRPSLNFLDFGKANELQALQSFTYLISSISGELSDKQSGVVPYLLKLLRKIPDASLETLRLLVDEKVKRADQSQFAGAIASLPLVDQGFFHNQFYHSQMDPTKQALGAKLYAAMASDTFREMFSAKTNSMNFDELIKDRKVVLVKGGYDSLGDEGMEIFLQFLIAQYYAAGRRLPILDEEKLVSIMVVDEGHTVLKSPVIAKILVELRKFGCGFLAATQVLDQIANEVKAAVYGATAIKIVGPVSSASGDAGQLAKDMYCSEQFIRSMKNVPRQYADWAFYVQATTNNGAVRVRVPYGVLEAMPIPKSVQDALDKLKPETRQPSNARTVPPPLPKEPPPSPEKEVKKPDDDDDPVMKKK